MPAEMIKNSLNWYEVLESILKTWGGPGGLLLVGWFFKEKIANYLLGQTNQEIKKLKQEIYNYENEDKTDYADWKFVYNKNNHHETLIKNKSFHGHKTSKNLIQIITLFEQINKGVYERIGEEIYYSKEKYFDSLTPEKAHSEIWKRIIKMVPYNYDRKKFQEKFKGTRWGEFWDSKDVIFRSPPNVG